MGSARFGSPHLTPHMANSRLGYTNPARLGEMKSLRVRICETLDEIESLRPHWDRLLCDFDGATTFASWEWLVPWWRAFRERRILLVLAFFDESSELVGLAPLCVEKRKVTPLVDLQVLH